MNIYVINGETVVWADSEAEAVRYYCSHNQDQVVSIELEDSYV